MSASVNSRWSTTKPPCSSRLCATNRFRKSAIAGPGHATQPLGLEETALALPGEQRLTVVKPADEVELGCGATGRGRAGGSTVRLAQAGIANSRKTRSASMSAAPIASCSGTPNGIAPRVSTELPNVTSEPRPSPRR